MIMKASCFKYGAENEKKTKESFLSIYKSYEEAKDHTTITPQKIPLISTFILKNLDFEYIMKKRISNLNILYKNLKSLSLFKMKDIKSPFTFPISFHDHETRESFRKLMTNNHVFPPVHWDLPNEVKNEFIYEKQLSDRILSLPIDQRYETNDMVMITELASKNKKN